MGETGRGAGETGTEITVVLTKRYYVTFFFFRVQLGSLRGGIGLGHETRWPTYDK